MGSKPCYFVGFNDIYDLGVHFGSHFGSIKKQICSSGGFPGIIPGIVRIVRIVRKWWGRLRLRTPLPHAPGVRMTVVYKLPQPIFIQYMFYRTFANRVYCLSLAVPRRVYIAGGGGVGVVVEGSRTR